ncbi:GNAT family N-acetyltransferase [uncultured Mailhella sp.]|uniref:GNAT family N-acetyltransferase n=1 Tax=uncultured Mailhella sp. TaxID=1981031 RepID=UPI0025CDCDDF|nr:GNAT family N-acetyltransferase [uncultured Mailhella sp.]
METFILSHGSLDWNPPLAALWTAIAARSGRADPFSCTPAWQLSFHDAFAPRRRLFIHVDEENVLTFAELTLLSGHILLAPVEAHWISASPLLGPNADDLLVRMLPALADFYHGALPCLLLSGLEEGNDLFPRLSRRTADIFHVLPQPATLQRSASLMGGMDGYLSRRSGNFRAKMKKARRKAAENGVTFERVVPATVQEADAVYARMVAVEERSWKGREHCGMTEPPSLEFYRVMMRRLSLYRGGRVMFAAQEGKDIGFIFGGMAGRFYRGQQFSYDADYKTLSIGDLLQMEQLAWLCEENAVRYDMGMSDHPAMAYKTHWAELEQKLLAWLLIPKARL